MNDKYAAEDISLKSDTDVKKCMLCGKCSGTCPVFDEMDIKPHQFVQYLLHGQTDVLLKSESIWKCLSCMACVERCPRGVAPQSVIEAVRNTVIGAADGNTLKAEDIPPIVDEFIP